METEFVSPFQFNVFHVCCSCLTFLCFFVNIIVLLFSLTFFDTFDTCLRRREREKELPKEGQFSVSVNFPLFECVSHEKFVKNEIQKKVSFLMSENISFDNQNF